MARIRSLRLRRSAAVRLPVLLAATLGLSACTPVLYNFTGPQQMEQLQIETFHRNLSVGYPKGHDFDATWQADHSMACGGAYTSRTVHASDDGTDPETKYYCAPQGPASGHIMSTMVSIDGYTLIGFAPDRTFTDVEMACWAVNLTEMGSSRKWFEAHLVRETDFVARGSNLRYINPGFDHVAKIPRNPASSFNVSFVGDRITVWRGAQRLVRDTSKFSTDDRARRYQHCITDNGNGTVTVSQERDAGTRRVTVPGALPNGKVRFILTDHNYTPGKDRPLLATTWHWDDILVVQS